MNQMLTNTPTPPAEAAVICALVTASVSANREDVMAVVQPDWYTDERCSHIHNLIARFMADGSHVDAITVRQAAPSLSSWLDGILTTRITPSAVASYVQSLQASFRLRSLSQLGANLQTAAATGRDPEVVIASATASLASLENANVRRTMVGARSAFQMAMDAASAGQNDDNRISTGIPALDQMIGGLQAGRLYVVAARAGMGKSSVAAQVALRVARDGRAVCSYWLEMPTREVALRMVCADANVSFHKANAGGLDLMELGYLRAAQERLQVLPLSFDDTPGMSVESVISGARYWFAQHPNKPRGLLVVDYLQLMKTDADQTRDRQLGIITGALKNASKTLGVPVMLLSQLNREVEKRETKKPQLSDLRESGAIEQDADVVIFPHRADYYGGANGAAELIVAKQRGGPVGTIKVKWVPETMSFLPA
jgi:replicative DNA helicase